MGSLALAELQRRLSRWIRDPDSQPRLRGAEDPGTSVEDLVRSDARAAASRRLAVYADAYHARIRHALSHDLPVLAACLGEDGFHDLVKLYLLSSPPGHPSLRFAGSRLPAFLSGHPAAATFRRRWPFAPDLARLEWALVDAFDTADARVLRREDLLRVRQHVFECLQLFFHPSVSRLSLRWPVHRLVEAPPPSEQPARSEPTELLVWRCREEPRFRALATDEALALDAARAGAPFGALCTRLAQVLGEEAAAPRAARLLASWLDDGLLRAEP